MRKYWLVGSGYPQGRPEVWLMLRKFIQDIFPQDEMQQRIGDIPWLTEEEALAIWDSIPIPNQEGE